MSDETVVQTDGVTVSKFFNAEDFPVPAVAFDVDSSREDTVTLTLVDEIPEEFGIDQIGFHPEYGSEHWTASGDGVVRFERDVEPGDSFTTVYGVRMEEGQDETPFLAAPTVQIRGENVDDVVPPESTDVVRELAGGERDTVPGLEDEAELGAEVGAGVEGAGVESLEQEDAEILEGDVEFGEPGDEAGLSADAELGADEEPDAGDDEADEAPEGIDADDDAESEPEPGGAPSTEPEAAGFGADQPDPSAAAEGIAESEAQGFDGGDEAEAAETAAIGESADDGEPAAAAVFDAGDLAGELAAAIRNDEVDDDDLATLQEAFGGVPNSTQVEIEHLQSRVSELEAYSDALESFIDEEGTAEQLVTDIEDEVEGLSTELSALSDELTDVEASVEDAAGDREALRDRVADVEADAAAVDDLEETVERVRGDLEALDERVEDTEEAMLDVDELEGDLDDLEDDLEDVEEHVDDIEEWRSQLSDVFGT